MKIHIDRAELIAKVLKEVVYLIHAITLAPVVILVASLLPGDMIGFNVVGTIGLIVMVLAANAVATVPCTLIRKRLERKISKGSDHNLAAARSL